MKNTNNNDAASAWYRDDAHYQECLAVYSDADKGPKTYDKWLPIAEKGVADSGMTFRKVYIVPEDFLAWCEDKKMETDSRARSIYAMIMAYGGTPDTEIVDLT